jgi:hypothetical protein
MGSTRIAYDLLALDQHERHIGQQWPNGRHQQRPPAELRYSWLNILAGLPPQGET